jgi:hypothetical protein
MVEDEEFILFSLGNSPFLGKRILKGNLAFQGRESSDFFGINLAVMKS